MPLTPDEERQLEYLLRKKYSGTEPGEHSSTKDLPSAEPSPGPAKAHGDKIHLDSEK
jgi:hypothetical protein